MFASVASLVVLLRYVHPLNLGAMNFLLLPRCTFGFFLGATLCAVLPRDAGINLEQRNSHIRDVIQTLLIVGAVLMISYGGKSVWDFSMPFIFAAIIASFVAWPRTRLSAIAESRIPLWLGRHSYSIYMVHWLAYIATSTLARTAFHVRETKAGFVMIPAMGLSFLVLTIALILAAASVTYRYIEEPGRQLGRRLLDKSTI
jgi:peptidoglycan/LPS O-acetylase OafA/YrhL